MTAPAIQASADGAGTERAAAALTSARASRRRRLEVFVVPTLRLVGFCLVALFVFLYNAFAGGQIAPALAARFAALFVLYGLASWLTIYLLYGRTRLDIGFLFLTLDPLLWTLAIYGSGGENSWLIFLLIVRAADQTSLGSRRVLFFGHVSVACYLALLAYVVLVEGRTVVWPAEAAKIAILYGMNIYIALAARAADASRAKVREAMRLSSDLIARLEEKEKALGRSEERHREAVEKASDMIYTHTLDGTITSINAACSRISGFAAEEVLGHNIADFVDPAYLGIVAETSRARLEGEERPEPYRALTHARDGRPLWIEITARLLVEDGVPVGIQGIARDITRRVEAETALVESEREQKRIARRLATQHAVTQALAESETPEAATSAVLRLMGGELGVEHGALWTVDAAAGVLRCVETWRGEAEADGHGSSPS